jgi:3-isopropylmalate/(R)-2-methylmalate dehydratase large subunit
MAIEAVGRTVLRRGRQDPRIRQAPREARVQGYESDKDAKYFECTSSTPRGRTAVSGTQLPEITKDVSDSTDVKIDQAFLGACTNGIRRPRDRREAHQGLKVHPCVRFIVIPATVWFITRP